uniref:Uncharacterized protein n=1 Tax=Coturnix japonica TaxID=93934 RepID=A0A8C2TVR5_COTJA
MVQVIVSSAGAGCLQRWVLLELQGDVEPRGGGELPGSLLGDLHYTREVSGLVVPVLQELLQQRIAVHSQRSTDALYTAEIGLAGSFYIKCHPVSHTAQEGDPRVILVQDLWRRWGQCH